MNNEVVWGHHALPRTRRQCVAQMSRAHAVLHRTDMYFAEFNLRRQNNMWICASDVSKLTDWFTLHHLLPRSNELVSISTGVIGNDTINCDAAVAIGTASMTKLVSSASRQQLSENTAKDMAEPDHATLQQDYIFMLRSLMKTWLHI